MDDWSMHTHFRLMVCPFCKCSGSTIWRCQKEMNLTTTVILRESKTKRPSQNQDKLPQAQNWLTRLVDSPLIILPLTLSVALSSLRRYRIEILMILLSPTRQQTRSGKTPSDRSPLKSLVSLRKVCFSSHLFVSLQLLPLFLFLMMTRHLRCLQQSLVRDPLILSVLQPTHSP